MSKTFFKLLAVGVVSAIIYGCSGYSKLLKSEDKELMYSKAIEFYNAKKYQKTLQLFEEISHFYTGTTKEDSISYYSGASHYKMGDFEASGMIFDDFRRRFGRSPFLEDAEYMYAKGFYYSSPDPQRDQTTTQQAIHAINEYLDRYPKSAKKDALLVNIEELKLKLYDKAYLNAKSYFKTEKYKSAVVALKNALNQFPETPHREEILYLITKSAYLLAGNSIDNLQRDRYLNMMDDYYNFASEFPESKYMKELTKMQDDAKTHLAKYNKDNIPENGNQEK